MNSEHSLNILVIDDESGIRKLLRIALEGAGYGVRECATGTLGLQECATRPPDAVLLDLGLPDMDGIDVVRRLREWASVPVLVLTVRDQEEIKIAALDAGADDYLTKPFSTGELLARLRALLRRLPVGNEPALLRVGEIEIDQAQRIVRRAGQEVHLTVKEYGMLRMLARHLGRVVTHRQILRELWGPNSEENTHYLRVHMAHLRQKLEREPHHPRHLRTEAGIGFRLVEE